MLGEQLVEPFRRGHRARVQGQRTTKMLRDGVETDAVRVRDDPAEEAYCLIESQNSVFM